MRAELLVVEGCPHTSEAARRFRVALDVTGHNFVPVTVRLIDTAHGPEGSCLTSPTFRLNGIDLLPDDTAIAGQACRWLIPTTAELADAITMTN